MALLAERLSALNRRGPRAPFPPRYLAIGLGSGLLLVSGESQLALIYARTPQIFGLLSCCALFAGMAILILAAMPIRPPERLRRLATRLRLPLVTLTVLLAALWLLFFVGTTYTAFSQPAEEAYYNDVISFSHAGAELVLAGQNPYTSDAAFRAALERFPHALPSPLRGQPFGTTYDYPHYPLVVEITGRYVAGDPAVQRAFDPATLHSYPALTYLLYAPVVLATGNILWLHLLVYLVLLGWLIWQAPGRLRVPAALVACTVVTIPRYSLMVDNEILCIALVLAAWHWRNTRWLGPLLLGLACAFKQYCWFFAPFFVLDALLAYGWREAGRRALVAAGAFLLPNLPFLLISPGPWLHSLTLPMSEPLYPLGVGVIVLSMGHVLPFGPPALYTALEAVAFAAALAASVRWRAVLGDAVLLLPLVPLLFAFRSPADYFAFAPWLALYAANGVFAARQCAASMPVTEADAARAPELLVPA